MRDRSSWVAALGVVLLGCSSAGQVESGEPEQSGASIAGGTQDTTTNAVMALVNTTGGACSGTTIAVNGQFGYLLTAAHCVVQIDSGGNVVVPVQQVTPEELLVVPGADYQAGLSSATYYPVQAFLMNPGYTGNSSGADIAVVRYVGATAATPTIPHMTAAEDDLAVGTSLRFVGYGQTPTNSQNSQRFSVVDTVDILYSDEIWSDESDGTGTCHGDSGGPSLRDLGGGQLRVAGIASYGTQGGCGAGGYSVGKRVSNYQSFIEGFLAQTPPAVGCTTCRTLAATSFGGCSAESGQCGEGSDCSAFLSCADACGQNDTACIQQCQADHPAGVDAYRALFECSCGDCPTECVNETACQEPACGLSYSDTTCNTCVEQRCCTETQACADDADCRTCATSASPPASCSSNALQGQMLTCTLSQCGQECGVPCGFNNDGACGTCITGSCCAESRACAGDVTCYRCATGQSTSGCSSSTLLTDMFDCLAACSGDPCGAAGGAGGQGGGGGTGGAAAGGGVGGGGGLAASGGAGAFDSGVGGSGAVGSDAGPAYYGGSRSSGGCACRAGRDSSLGAWPWALLGVAIGAWRRRRRR